MELKFEKLREKHLEQVRVWRMLPEVTKYMYTDPVITRESQKAWYNTIRDDDTQRNWVVDVDGVDIGLVSLKIYWSNKRGFWAYYIGDSTYLGKGIGKQIEFNMLRYVFDILKLNKLTCEVFAFNDKVVKIHEKYGSKIEGILKEHIYKNNQFNDVVVMGILKSEWVQIKEKFDIIEAEIEDIDAEDCPDVLVGGLGYEP
jgi:UDP-4-amino-4,6-dideoxy-N-acetyl-beta-L-altrosamine N-acetyltransferase